MGWISKITGLGLTGLGIKELNDYRKEVSAEGKDPLSPGVFISHFGKKAWDGVESLIGRHKKGLEANKNMGGMAYARKKNMGLKMKKGGSVKSKKSKKKSRGTGAAKRGTKFKGTF